MTHELPAPNTELTPLSPEQLASMEAFPALSADVAAYRAAWHTFKHEHTMYDPDGNLPLQPTPGTRKFADTQVETLPYSHFYLKFANYRDFGIRMSYFYNLRHRGEPPCLESATMHAPEPDATLADEVYSYQAQQTLPRDLDAPREVRHPAYDFLGDVLHGWIHYPDQIHPGSLLGQRLQTLHPIIPAEKRTDFTMAGFMTSRVVKILRNLDIFGIPSSYPASMAPTKDEVREWHQYETAHQEGHRPFTLPDMLGMMAMQNVRAFQAVRPEGTGWKPLEHLGRILPAAE